MYWTSLHETWCSAGHLPLFDLKRWIFFSILDDKELCIKARLFFKHGAKWSGMDNMMVVTIFLFFLAQVKPSSSTGLTNSHEESSTIGWVSEPDGRGTFSLMTSCMLTLSLCVWSAMHLNIPHYRESTWQFWLRHVKWGLVGVFAPELVVFAAWRQYISANAVRYEVSQTVDAKNNDKEYKLMETKNADYFSHNESVKSPWTMVHGFYAGMGGFTFKTGGLLEMEPNTFIQDFPRLTLTARGVALLAKCRLLPDLPEEDLVDKSKADGLAKFLACLQAGWMFVQIIGRMILGLPVTLLEVNTLGHVICALVIYVLWWNKPRSINEPTRLVGDQIRPICAYMFMSSCVSSPNRGSKSLPKSTRIAPELSTLAFYPQRPIDESWQTGRCQEINAADRLPIIIPPENVMDAIEGRNSSVIELPTSQARLSNASIPRSTRACSSGSFELRPSMISTVGPDMPEISGQHSEEPQSPTTQQLQRRRLAAEAVQLYPAIRTRFNIKTTTDSDESAEQWLEPILEELVTEDSGNWPNQGLLRGMPGLIMGMVLWTVSMVYGGVHAAAWNDYFPSEVEAWMWRCSSVYAAFCGLLWLAINMLAHMSRSLNNYWDEVLAFRVHWMNYWVLGFLCSMCGVTYILARVFLVVEAFISLRQLPLAAYQTPDWTQLIPHF